MSRMEEIKLFCKEYVNTYNLNITPKIKKKRKIGVVAYINSAECYNKRLYRIYLNSEYIHCGIGFLRSVIFHEMTHIADTITFQNLPYKDFIMTMSTYSEIHAAEIEFDAKLGYDKEFITLQSQVWGATKFFTVEESTLNQVEEFKNSYYHNSFENLLYVIGYVRCLKKYNINYTQELLNQLPQFDFVHEYIKSLINSESIDRKIALEMFSIIQDYRKQGKVMITNLKL